jgi:hypothetical protein
MIENRKLQFVRSDEYVRGTHWRPLSHILVNHEHLTGDRLHDALSDGSLSPKNIQVEDPYHQGRFLDDYFIDPFTEIVMHKKAADVPISTLVNLSSFAVLGAGVRLGERVTIRGLTELRPRAHVEDDAYIEERSLIGKAALVGAGGYVSRAVTLVRPPDWELTSRLVQPRCWIKSAV